MNAGKIINWGIIGTGVAARAFARGLVHASGAQLVGIASRRIESATAFAQAFGASRAYGGSVELLADTHIDIVYIATPNHRHLQDALACLQAGKGVLCEKPFALNAAEARRIVESARSKRLFCMEAMWMRFNPLVQQAKRLIADGAIGGVQTLTADFALPIDQDPRNRWMDPAQGGGAMLDRGVYGISLAYFLLGHPAQIAGTATLAPTGVDVQSAYLLQYPGGASAVLWSSLATHGSNEAVIMGSTGKILLHDPFIRPHRLTLKRIAAPAPAAEASPPATPGLSTRLKGNVLAQRIFRRMRRRRSELDILRPIAGTGYQFEAIEAMRCLRQGQTESPVMPLDETVQIMATMDQIRAMWRGVA